jgi:sarcosine oxidase, alpha subunit family, heterotetrameric form
MSARLANGGRIDRNQPLQFTFNGQALSGYAGDTLASALLANGIHLVNRSVKLHRPRGIIGRGPEEPNALLQIGQGASALADQRATQVVLRDGMQARSINGYPSLKFDFMALFDRASKLLPAGFYYKTFMGPSGWWEQYEKIIRPASGMGLVPEGPDPDRYEKRDLHCQVLVVGGGPAGVMAALVLARAGVPVALAHEQSQFGGGLLASRSNIEGRPAQDWLEAAIVELAALPHVTLMAATTVFGHYDQHYLGAVERLHETRPDAPVRERFWKIRCEQLILAAGAIERPIAFANNDRPGIMTASAVHEYIERYAVLPGRQAVVFTNNDAAYACALSLQRAGAEVCVVDSRANPGAVAQSARQAGLAVHADAQVTNTAGRLRVSSVRVRHADQRSQTLPCDLLAVSGGWNPSVHLHSHARGSLQWDEALASFIPQQDLAGVASVGAMAGEFEPNAALAGACKAAEQAAAALGYSVDATQPPVISDAEPGPTGVKALWRVAGEGPAFVDMQNDVKASDIELALREGYRSIEHVKRYSVLGFGTDQGKLGNILGLGIVSELVGMSPAEVGTTTYRPAWTPVTFGALVGTETGALFDPIRYTPMHQWHVERGAVFEDVGQWKRARYYPRPGEDMDAAVARECLATRDGVGVLDYSTLGKIDIQGPDAVTLLERVTVNNWQKLGIGRCRYGLMLDENGMVLDDGVTARLGEHHFLMSTSTGGAARVMGWLEQWLQTEWPDLDVRLTSVTDQYATISLAGPHSRALIADLGTDIDLSAQAFEFMSLRTGTVAGVAARVQRVSFTGELGFEITVSADYGAYLWEQIFLRESAFSITPYGTEAMHVMRAEKGFIIVGQDTDGSISPLDVGMAGMISTRKDCLGKRSLNRSELQRDERPQWVGLKPRKPDAVIAEGAQIIASANPAGETPMHGWVTSSYFAPRLGYAYALGFVNAGRSRHGETLYAWDLDGGAIELEVTAPAQYDVEGVRQHVE